MYKILKIPKKSGGFREISIPDPDLKQKQKEILTKLYRILLTEEHYKGDLYFAKGFIPNKGIYHNALPHAGKKFVLNVDIKDFFPSCKKSNFPANKLKKYLTNDEYEALFYKDSLPQGAPTSPFVSNYYLAKADGIIFYLLRVHISDDIVYTRYADDITVSSNSKAIFGKACLTIIESVLKSYGFSLNKDKIRKITPSQRQEITGLCINSGKPTVSRKIRRIIRAAVHNMTKQGHATKEELNKIKGLISFVNQCPAHKEWCKQMFTKLELVKVTR